MVTIEVQRPELHEPRLEPDDRPCTAETADCTCPDFCERDHANE